MGPVEFLITSEALVELLDPSREAMDRETAIETFDEFESDIHRITLREFVSRLGGEPPILLTSADVAGRSVAQLAWTWNAEGEAAFGSSKQLPARLKFG